MFTLLTRWAVANRLLVLIAITSLCIAAAFALPKLNLDAFPDVTNVQVAINTEAPGLAAEEVEKLITYPIEAVMYALPGVAEVRSISKTGLSGITVVFNEGTDIYLPVSWCSSACRPRANLFRRAPVFRKWGRIPPVWGRYSSMYCRPNPVQVTT